MVSSTWDLYRTDDNVMSKAFMLDQPLILKSILQILQELLETVSFCIVFIPGLLPGIRDVVMCDVDCYISTGYCLSTALFIL